jgi:hypothetical protein
MSIYGHIEEEIRRRSLVPPCLFRRAHSSFMGKLFQGREIIEG